MRKNLAYMIILALAAIMAAFVSCDASGALGTSELRLNIIQEGESRSLTTDSVYTAGLTPASYEYKAICTSTSGAHGEVSSWTTLSVSESSATIRKIDRGSWTIHVRAKNSSGGVILQGQASIDLTQSNHTLAITLKNSITDYSVASPSNVTVSIGVTVPSLSDGQIVVRYTTLANVGNLNATGTGGNSVSMTKKANYSTSISGSSIVATTASSGNTAYYGSVNLAPGLYVLQVLYKDSSEVTSGQTMAIHVEEKAPFAINGTLTSGEYIDLELSPITISSNDIELSFSTEPHCVSGGHIGAAVSYTGTVTSPVYKWYVNGILDSGQTGATYTSTATYSDGEYAVTCLVSGTVSGVAAAGYVSSDITVAPPKITFNGNGGTPSATNQSFTYNTAGTITATATRAGYQFAGWGTTTSGGTVYGENGHGTNTTITLTSDITLYAQWFQTGTLASTYESYDAGVYSGNTETDYTVTYTPVSTPDSYSWSVVGNSVGTVTNGVGNNTIPTSGASGTLNLASADTYTVTCAAIKNGYRFESNIQYSISGSRSPVSVRPCYANGTTDNYIDNDRGFYIPAVFPYVAVTYDDGTEEIYDADGNYSLLQVIEGPGSLQYIRSEYKPKYWLCFYYTYTENGVSTPETVLHSYYDD